MALVTINDALKSQRRLPVRSSRERSWGESLTVDLYSDDPALLHTPQPRDHRIVVYFTAGSGHLEQSRGGKSYKSQVRSGDILILPSGQSALWRGAVPAQLRMRVPAHQLDAAWTAVGAYPSRQVELQDVCRTRDPFLAQLAALFTSELDAPEHPAQALIAESASAMLASHLVRKYCVFDGKQEVCSAALPAHIVNRIADNVESHLAGAIRLQDLASIASVSPFHFARAFKVTTGQTPMQFVNCIRMRRAKILLEGSPRRTIEEAGRLVGFTNPSHFTRRFAAHFHQTPSEYRYLAR